MNDSILNTIKKMLGIEVGFEGFDTDIIIHINTVLGILYQLGIERSFSITGANETWSDYISDMSKLEMIKTYIYLKVRLIFDPPASGSVIDVINRQISELEWRINVTVDPKE